jgi:hypothetical protein
MVKSHFVLFGCFVLVACSGSDSKSSRSAGTDGGGTPNVENSDAGGNATAGPVGGANAVTNRGGTAASVASAGTSGTNLTADAVGTLRYDATSFRFGVNPGYYGPGIDRRESAQMSRAAGATSMRTTLPEYYLAQWGDAIEVGDYSYYASLGLGNYVCFLHGPSHPHSNAPASAADWELAHYSPKHLYEPIFLADGSVNPENYWAAYVERVAKNYGAFIDIYEVWNEPDQVGSNWQATQAWTQSPPKPADLIWWNDTIFAYIRALRITHEVVHRFDTEAAVTVGGIGYASFLSALLRYTDEPNAGAVTSEYPSTAAAYLDLVSYHYYPVFGGGSSDRGVDGLLQAKNELSSVISTAGVAPKRFVVTETGAPRYAVGGNVGGVDYSVNYLLKAFVQGRFEGLVGIDWFAQGDGAVEGASTDSFDYMGLYFDYSKATQVTDTRMSPQGSAYAWISGWLNGAALAPADLAALSLPATVRGASFKSKSGATLHALWALTSNDESATAKVTLPAAGAVSVHRFDTTKGETQATLTPTGGSVVLDLTARPLIAEIQ